MDTTACTSRPRVLRSRCRYRHPCWRPPRPSTIFAVWTSVLIAALIAAAALPGAGRASVYPDGSPSPATDSPGTTSFPNTDNGIHLGLAFDFATQDASGVSSNVDYIWGGYFADWDFGFYPSVPHNDAYLPFDQDSYPQSVPGHSLAWYQANHPDWVVYRCDGKTPAYYGTGDSNVPLDFSNPGVQAYQLQQAAQLLQRGADGVAFDNFSFTNYENRCGVYDNGTWTPLGYPGLNQDNAKLDSDMMDWLRHMREILTQQFPGKSLAVNMPPFLSGPAHVEQVAPYIDMDFDEAGFTTWGQANLSDSAWQNEVASLQYLNSQGKAFVVNGIVPAASDAAVTHDQLNWVLGNYLLVKGSHSYAYVYAGNSAGSSGYGTFYDRREYHSAIGIPTTSMYQSQHVYMRNYSRGLAIVNPSSSETFTVALGQPYVDMYGTTYTSLTLSPTTGIVLLLPVVEAPASTPAAAAASSTRARTVVKSRRRHRRSGRHSHHRRVRKAHKRSSRRRGPAKTHRHSRR